ncbi:aliphatic sulfonate ABC transporter substrate-binding protein [Nitrospirillum pindoramense]|uniref:Putative aliphatic sulfonates-binding protein n=1 Tax=Nitrospirillum amazonense TaxID=28077 RepID=A0A560GZX8_9PROT|nr:aliphatic sulfonate ABC transporter substrate-binding protein [Nitrospirillum amazonense]TWB39607.1 sulfonate transport system substrate-binding protein [Nitrospirillum amazonense]
MTTRIIIKAPAPTRRTLLAGGVALAAAPLLRPASALAQPAAKITELRLDYATYSPVSLLLKDKGWLEEELKADGIGVRWVQSLGSNKALEFLNAGSLDFGSTASAAALLGRIGGNPIRSVYVYSKPEWTALVVPADSPAKTIADLKGKRIAVTRGTDPHIFLVRALAGAGLTQDDVKLVLLQHPDGKQALLRGDVDAWAGLDPLMAAAEIENGARLLYRNPAFNSWGALNVRDAFAAENPGVVQKVLAAYEKARTFAQGHPDALAASLTAQTKLADAVVARQLQRTDLSQGHLKPAQADSVVASGLAMQQVGLIEAGVDVRKAAAELVDSRFAVG